MRDGDEKLGVGRPIFEAGRLEWDKTGGAATPT